MTRVRIIRATVAARRPVMAGEVLDLPDQEAALLLRLRKAEALGGTVAPGADGPLTTESAGALVAGRRAKRANGPTG
jgi:hypothetical protein